MYALVEIKGKQYRVEKGSLLKVDCLAKESGDSIEFDKVLLFSDEKGSQIGSPYVKGAKVMARVGATEKAKKVKVYKFKRRKGYHLSRGHRQQYTTVKVEEISI